MDNSHKIGVNVLASLLRLVAGVFIGLISSRLLLAYLGESGYGALTALGASGAFLLFFTISLGRGMQREISFYFGRSDLLKARQVFSVVTCVFSLLSVLFFVVMVYLRPFILGLLSFPSESVGVVGWVYIISISQIAVSIFVSPFRAVLEATQNIATISLLETILSVLNLGLVSILPFFQGDKLLLVSVMQALLSLIGACSVLFVSRWKCPGVVSFVWGGGIRQLRGVFDITSWSLFGHLAWIVRNEGSVFALNVFFGPAVNASYALALRLHGLQNELAFAVIRAVQPALTSAVACGDQKLERSLTLLGSKLPVLASLFLWVPLLFCAEDFLHFWLGKTPEYAALFVRILGVGMLGLASYGHQMALESRARLAGVTLWMTLPPIAAFAALCLVQFKFSFPVWVFPASQASVGIVLVFFVRPFLHGSILGISPSKWFWSVLWPVCLTHAIGVLAVLPVWLLLPMGFIRLVTVGIFSSVAMIGYIWFWGLAENERTVILGLFVRLRDRFFSRTTRKLSK